MFRGWRRPEKGFFEEFEKEMQEMNELIESMMRTAGSEPLVYGMSFQVGPDGVPHIEHFGNIGPQGVFRGSSVREPFTSSMIDEKSNEFRITAEMPGVQKEDIEVSATEEEVAVKAESGERKYFKTIKASQPVDPDSAMAKYNNGVLEVALKLKEPAKTKGRTIKIE